MMASLLLTATLGLPQEDVSKLLEQLGADEIEDRQRAQAVVMRLPSKQRSALDRLAADADFEVRWRIQDALERVPAGFRHLRSVQAGAGGFGLTRGGTQVALYLEDGSLAIEDVEWGPQGIRIEGGSVPGTRAAPVFSPDGSLCAAQLREDEVTVLEAPGWEIRETVSVPRRSEDRALAVDNTGLLLVTETPDLNSYFKRGATEFPLKLCGTIALSDDGRRAAGLRDQVDSNSISNQGGTRVNNWKGTSQVQLHDLRTMKAVARSSIREENLTSVDRPAGGPSGLLAASADLGRVVQMDWTRQKLLLWSGPVSAPPLIRPLSLPAMSMAVSPDGESLLTGHADGRLKRWDLLSMRERGSSRMGGPVRALKWAAGPGGDTLGVLAGSILVLYRGD
jgi:WD40 repeat protein